MLTHGGSVAASRSTSGTVRYGSRSTVRWRQVGVPLNTCIRYICEQGLRDFSPRTIADCPRGGRTIGTVDAGFRLEHSASPEGLWRAPAFSPRRMRAACGAAFSIRRAVSGVREALAWRTFKISAALDTARPEGFDHFGFDQVARMGRIFQGHFVPPNGSRSNQYHWRCWRCGMSGPHAYAWRFSGGPLLLGRNTEPPCVSMRTNLFS
jgi:hypothetical protein